MKWVQTPFHPFLICNAANSGNKALNGRNKVPSFLRLLNSSEALNSGPALVHTVLGKVPSPCFIYVMQ